MEGMIVDGHELGPLIRITAIALQKHLLFGKRDFKSPFAVRKGALQKLYRQGAGETSFRPAKVLPLASYFANVF